VTWYRNNGPAGWKENNSQFPILAYAREALSFMNRANGDSVRRTFSSVRDVFFADNSEWRHTPPALSAHGSAQEPIPDAVKEDQGIEQDVANYGA
jgi:hypothetical protein